MKEELKTLNDIYKESNKVPKDLIEDIRNAGIKYAKLHLDYIKEDETEFSRGIYNFCLEFFNLTKEDLKEAEE